MSAIPHAPIPRAAGRWPSADAYVEYLEATAKRWALAIRFDTEVRRIDRVGGAYTVALSEGALRARWVVVATGYDHVPHTPEWPGREGFAGELLHAADYLNPSPFVGRDVLVVGCGNSGTEIAVQLARAGAARVRLALRTPPNLFPRELHRVPVQVLGALTQYQPTWLADRSGRLLQRLAWGDLTRYGLPPAPMGIATELRSKGLGPVVDTGFVDEVRRGRVEIVSTLVDFENHDVQLAGGAVVRPDTVIAATGYRHGLEPLVGHLGVLSGSGRPARVDGGPLPQAPGLYFNGYRLPVSGQLTAMRASSRRIAREVVGERRRAARASGASRTRGRRVCARATTLEGTPA
jgi:putative flavoprotein involved in K+ transport